MSSVTVVFAVSVYIVMHVSHYCHPKFSYCLLHSSFSLSSLSAISHTLSLTASLTIHIHLLCTRSVITHAITHRQPTSAIIVKNTVVLNQALPKFFTVVYTSAVIIRIFPSHLLHLPSLSAGTHLTLFAHFCNRRSCLS